MLGEYNIKIILFAIICICFISYLYIGICSYNKYGKSKINVLFYISCVSTGLWVIGYALMLIYSNIKITNTWRIVYILGSCFFYAIWIFFAFSFKKSNTQRLLAENQLQHYMYYDMLTEVFNRKKMLEDINLLLDYKNQEFAILFINVDNFKSSNDIYGHQSGDYILKNITVRLKNIINCTDTIYRIGSDEFIVIIRDLKSSSSATEIAEKFVKVLSDAFAYNNNLIYIGASVGISLFPKHGTNVDILIKKSNLAMYEVKNRGGCGYIIYNNIMSDNNIHMIEMEKNLRNALKKNEFMTYYQPIIDLKSMKVLSAESLIRWKREEIIIQPLEFIPVAKKIGKMVEIDNWMIYNACSQCKKWHDLGVKDFSISVNTSYNQLIQLNFVQLVMKILDEHLLAPMYLNLEITEDESIVDIDLIVKILLELKSHGIKISTDDFGTGYSSIRWISNLPIDSIKIDKSFIQNLNENSKSTILIKSIIAAANSLNIKVVAEGIETEKEFALLKELKCDYIQGYFIGKPMSASEFQNKFIK